MEIYDVPQLAELLRVSQRTVRMYLTKGTLIGRKVGKRWLVSEDALRAFLMRGDDTRRHRHRLVTNLHQCHKVDSSMRTNRMSRPSSTRHPARKCQTIPPD
jgi:excisionase family DNA binding protein